MTEQLTEALRRGAGAPTAGFDATDVERRARRRHRGRRLAGAGVIAAIVAVAGALAAVGLTGDRSSVADGGDAFCDVLAEPVWGRTDDGLAVEVIVFIEPDGDDDMRERLERELEEDPDVASMTVVDQADAYEEFQRLFADTPEMLAAVTPEVLPPSARIALTPEVDLESWAEQWEDETGVFRVVTAESASPPYDATIGTALLGPFDAFRPGDVVPITASSDAIDALTDAAPPAVSEALAEIEDAVEERSQGALRSVEVTTELTEAARTVIDHADSACGDDWR